MSRTTTCATLRAPHCLASPGARADGRVHEPGQHLPTLRLGALELAVPTADGHMPAVGAAFHTGAWRIGKGNPRLWAVASGTFGPGTPAHDAARTHRVTASNTRTGR